MTTKNKVVMPMVGEDGNAYAIMGRFQRAARRAGWTREEIEAVLDEARSGDYNHLLRTMMKHSDEPGVRSGEDE